MSTVINQPSMSSADLQVIMNMTPEKAVQYLERKGLHIAWNWHETADALHARAFTVAKVAKLDILADLRNGLKGRSLAEYKRDLEPILQAKGWWGKKQTVALSTGEVKIHEEGSPRRLETIYRTNMQSAYNAARFEQAMQAQETHPYAMYIAVNDSSSRPSHAALHGRIFRLDDPVWQSICPPNGFRCRCRFVTLTEKQVQKMGIKVQAAKLTTERVLSHYDENGKHVYRDITAVDLGNGKKFVPDSGFDSGPQASHIFDDYLYQKAKATLPDTTARKVMQDTLLSAVRMRAWEGFIRQMLNGAKQSKQSFGIGVMGESELAHAKKNGLIPASGVIYVTDRLLSSPKATRHQNAGNGLTEQEWIELPLLLSKPEMVLYDTVHKNYLYILKSVNNVSTKLALRLNYKTGALSIDDAATVFKIPTSQISAGIKGKEYEII